MTILKKRRKISQEEQSENDELYRQYMSWLHYVGIKYKDVPTHCLEHRRNQLALQDIIIPFLFTAVTFILSYVFCFNIINEKILFVHIAFSTIISLIVAMVPGMLSTFVLSRKNRSREYDELVEEIKWRERQNGEKVDWNIHFGKPCKSMKPVNK